MNPLVSTIVPIYGVEKYIAQCANSLFLQTYDNLEFIFVNDCTKDNSIVILQEVIQHYPNRVEHVHIIEHDHNQGLAASRNSGVEAAHGEWLMHVDSDDFIDPTTVAECVKKAEYPLDQVDTFEDCGGCEYKSICRYNYTIAGRSK